MERQKINRRLRLIVKTLAVFFMFYYVGICQSSGKASSDKFEVVRVYIQNWLSNLNDDNMIISSSRLKKEIIDDWQNQCNKFQIISVRKPEDYNLGHIPNSINIYWIDILNDKNLSLIDSKKTSILYCYYGHGSMISFTILSLLGYNCLSLNFGMMDWNTDALVKEPWDQMADYDVETSANVPAEVYNLPVLISEKNDAVNIIKEMAEKYLAGEGSPVIRSTNVEEIIEKWINENDKYQLVDLRSGKNYEAGHIPNAVNIPWKEIVEIENLHKLDPTKIVIAYSENGQIGQMIATVLNLLGYQSVNLLFGMMDWNKAYVDESLQWKDASAHPIEYSKK